MVRCTCGFQLHSAKAPLSGKWMNLFARWILQWRSSFYQEEEALLNEMEVTGQAFEDMQEQNSRLIQQLREKDDANFKLMSERIKSNQLHKLSREEKEALKDQVSRLICKLTWAPLGWKLFWLLKPQDYWSFHGRLQGVTNRMLALTLHVYGLKLTNFVTISVPPANMSL